MKSVKVIGASVILGVLIGAGALLPRVETVGVQPGRAFAEAQDAAPPPVALNDLEKKLVESLTGARLAGRWRLVKDGAPGEEKEDEYTIHSIKKLSSELWWITARVRYGGKDVTVPVPVKILWAGDTPVLSVTDAGLPGLGTYSARVLFYGGLYTGTWSGGDHGGFLQGAIHPPEKSAEKNAGQPGGQARQEEE